MLPPTNISAFATTPDPSTNPQFGANGAANADDSSRAASATQGKSAPATRADDASNASKANSGSNFRQVLQQRIAQDEAATQGNRAASAEAKVAAQASDTKVAKNQPKSASLSQGSTPLTPHGVAPVMQAATGATQTALAGAVADGLGNSEAVSVSGPNSAGGLALQAPTTAAAATLPASPSTQTVGANLLSDAAVAQQLLSFPPAELESAATDQAQAPSSESIGTVFGADAPSQSQAASQSVFGPMASAFIHVQAGELAHLAGREGAGSGLSTASKTQAGSDSTGVSDALGIPSVTSADNAIAQAQSASIMNPQSTASTESSAPVASAVIPYQMGSDAWRSDVSSHVLYLSQQNLQSAELHLNPAHLSPLNISISVENNQTNLAFTAAHEATRQAMQDSLPQLRDLFAAHGISLGHASVGDSSGGSAQTGDDSSATSSGNRSLSSSLANEATGSSTTVPAATSALRLHALQTIDTFV